MQSLSFSEEQLKLIDFLCWSGSNYLQLIFGHPWRQMIIDFTNCKNFSTFPKDDRKKVQVESHLESVFLEKKNWIKRLKEEFENHLERFYHWIPPLSKGNTFKTRHPPPKYRWVQLQLEISFTWMRTYFVGHN